MTSPGRNDPCGGSGWKSKRCRLERADTTRRADAPADAPRRRAVAKLFALADRSELATHREVTSIAFGGKASRTDPASIS